MNKKRFILALVIYAVIIVAVFSVLMVKSYKEVNSSSSISDMREGLDILYEDFSKRLTINFTHMFKPLENTTNNGSMTVNIMMKSCRFKVDFDCVIFQPDIKSGKYLFNLENNLNKKIVFTGAEISGGASCSIIDEVVVNKYEGFYFIIEDCEYFDPAAKLKVFYYNFGSSSDFIHTSQADLIIR